MGQARTMHPLSGFAGLTSGPWYIDLGAVVAILTGLRYLWTYAMWPFLRALWAALVAAPQIASGMREVVLILEADVVGKLAAIMELNVALTDRATKQDERITSMEVRLARMEGMMSVASRALGSAGDGTGS